MQNGADAQNYQYGYGWRRVHDPAGEAVQHGGGWPGYNTTFLRLLEEDTMVAVFCNQTGCDGLARSEVWEGVADIAFGRQPRLPRTLAEYEDKTVDPAAFPPLCGEYEDNVSVYLKDGSLWLKLYYREQNIDSQLVPIGVGQFISRTANLRITLDGKTVLARLMDKPVTYKRV